MAYDGKSLDEYVDVAERLQDFADATEGKGTVQTISWDVVTLEGEWPKDSRAGGSQAKKGEAIKRTYVVYRAAAYRHDADPRPGMGIAWEPWPGITPYTHDSELMNAETAAWGRAIVACGIVANRKLASRQEVRNRQVDQEASTESEPVAPAAKPKGKPKPAKTAPSKEAVTALLNLYAKSGMETEPREDSPENFDRHAILRLLLASHGAGNAGGPEECFKALNKAQFEGVWKALAEAGEEVSPS